MDARRTRMVGPDIMRIVAALLVTWFHLAYWVTTKNPDSPYAFPELEWTARYGWMGVHLFFVISGIVISQSAYGREPLDFAAARFWRLFPTALICASITGTVLALGLSWLPSDRIGERMIRSAFFWPLPPWVDGVYWTLWVEIAFYLLVFALIFFPATRPHFERIIIALSLPLAGVWVFYGPAFFDGKVDQRLAELLLWRDLMMFASGVIIARSWREGWSIGRLTALALLIYPACLSIHSVDPRDGAIPPIIWTACLAITLASPYWTRAIPARWHRLISVAAISTYPLYLLHVTGGIAVLRACSWFGVNRFVSLALAIVLVSAASLAVGAIIEPAFRRRARAAVTHAIRSADRSFRNLRANS